MSLASTITKRLLAEREVEEARERQRVEAQIAAGPPTRSGITAEAWASHHRHGWVVCPGKGTTCADPVCKMGAACGELRAIGLDGMSQPLKRKKRPPCGAKTRDGSPCEMRIEPGSRRCRLHGGLSTGPKTEKGRNRLAREMRFRKHVAKWDAIAVGKAAS